MHEGCQEHTLCVAHMQSIDSLPVQRDRHVHSSVGFTFGDWKQSLGKVLKLCFGAQGPAVPASAKFPNSGRTEHTSRRYSQYAASTSQEAPASPQDSFNKR